MGYSLTFSPSDCPVIGNFRHVFLMDVVNEPSVGNPKIPAILFYLFQNMFAAITPALAIGAAAERGRFLPAVIFMAIWTTVVYDFLAYWTWNPSGWVFKLGGETLSSKFSWIFMQWPDFKEPFFAFL